MARIFLLVVAMLFAGCGERPAEQPVQKKEEAVDKLPKKLEEHVVTRRHIEIYNLRAVIAKAQQVLSERPPNWLEVKHIETKKCVTVVKKKKKSQKCKTIRSRRVDFDIVLAVAHVDNPLKIEQIVFRRSEAPVTRRRLAKGEFAISWEKFQGCNTAFEITRPNGYIVLAMRRPIGEGKGHRDVVYTPYTAEIDTVEMRRAGYRYLRELFQTAQQRLATFEVPSHAFRKELVSAVVPVPLAARLALIEHIDPWRVIRNEPMLQLVSEVLIIAAVNKEKAYTCSMSKKGAYGLLQFIPPTYRNIVAEYPQAKLLKEFREGMNDHINAAMATMLLFDSDWSRVPPTHRAWLRDRPIELEKYLAAMYNSGKAAKAIARHGAEWIEHMPAETKVYLRKLAEVRKVLAR